MPTHPRQAPPPDTRRFFCPCPRGLEEFLRAELLALGADFIEAVGGGVRCRGPLELGYRINLHSRIASRVLMQLVHGTVRDEDQLHAMCMNLPWETIFDPAQTLRVDLVAIRSAWRSLNFATLRVKDAICDRLREARGTRPSIDTANPDVRVSVFVEQQRATVYIDLSGEALFKRGWRAGEDAKGEAPIKENLAAGLIALSGWQPDQPLLDPFCGSGTILLEAAQIALHRAPGLGRSFAIESLKLHDAAIWKRLKAEAQHAFDEQTKRHFGPDRALRPFAISIHGSDIDDRMIERARRNLRSAGLPEGCVQFHAQDAARLTPPSEPGVILANPPYGERVDLPVETWRALGERLRADFGGWRALFITSDRKLPGHLGLRERRKTPPFNGQIECRLFEFEMRTHRPRRPDLDDASGELPAVQGTSH